jgi:hypothetical protein
MQRQRNRVVQGLALAIAVLFIPRPSFAQG